jgi:hypothetical protein
MENLNISLANVKEITAGMAYKVECAWWVPHQLMPNMKTARLEVSQQLFASYQSEGNNVLHSTVSGDETWVHHYTLKMKIQSLV